MEKLIVCHKGTVKGTLKNTNRVDVTVLKAGFPSLFSTVAQYDKKTAIFTL